MASFETVCAVCGKPFRMVSGTDTIEALAASPHVHAPGTEGDEGCMAKWQQSAAARELEEAEAQLAAAQSRVAGLRASQAPEEGEAHDLTVAELRALAQANNIDLGDASRKADIRDKVIAGLNVAGLRDLAAREGIDLHGARTRDDIVAALNAEPEEEEPPHEEPSGFSPVANNG